MEFKIDSLPALKQVSDYLIEHIKECPIVLLKGQMGTGKTTLVSNLMKHLGSVDSVSSPTYSLVNEYLTNGGITIYHFDFYRINSEEEAMDIGVEEYFDSGKICLIEWPSMIPNLLPERYIEVNIELSDDYSRIFNVIL